MGNKNSKNKTGQTKTPKQQIKRDPTLWIPSDIIPSQAKFQKIDIVVYGRLYDSYLKLHPQVTNTVEQDIKQMVQQKRKVRSPYPGQIVNEIKRLYRDQQFPVYDVLNFCLTYNQIELMEFICTQELIETDLFCREYFKWTMHKILQDAAVLTKLGAINIFASYMIPERISKDKIEQIINNASHAYFKDLNTRMIDAGMNGRANRIVQTRQALIENVDIEFPKELIGIVIGYAFGMFHKK